MKYPYIPKPKLGLTRSLDEAKSLFLTSRTLQDVANVLEVHPGHLNWWLYSNPSHKGYITFTIPKKMGGSRTISVPPKSIGILQKKLKLILDQIYQPKSCAFGFIANRSIVDGAQKHKKKARWILNIDIKDFYPSINFGRVYGLFKAIGLGHKSATIFAHLVTYNGVLPQGASTSPVVSNMIIRQLDGKLMGLASRFHLTYTRYADDLSFSTTKKTFPKELVETNGTGLNTDNVELQDRLLNIFHATGFSINQNKTRLYSKGVRQEITGLTVNEFVNVRRRFIRQVRAMIFAGEKFGLVDAGREYIKEYAPVGRISRDCLNSETFDFASYFKQVIYGKLAFIRMVRGKSDKCYVNLCLKMAAIDSTPPNQIVEIKKMYEEFDVFICHASEDKEKIATPLFNALIKEKVTAFIDDAYIRWGDSFVEKINHALSRAKLIVVIISQNSLEKAWPKKELCAALAREIDGQTKILPLMVGTKTEIEGWLKNKFPLLQDKNYKIWNSAPSVVANEIKTLLL